ncbi:WbqC family protein [Candidatus Nitrosopelagicus sp.]|nr:WbqC family protein [Candidatus Nitrosopelagicus sp.]
MPYPGFFHKVSHSDVLIVQDVTKFDERFSNRNKIISSTEWTWLTVPIKKNHKDYLLKDVQIFNDLKWNKVHRKKLESAYNKSNFFNKYNTDLNLILEQKWEMLLELNMTIIKKINDWLKIKTKIIYESELGIEGEATNRLINICKAVNADVYLSGDMGHDYLNEELFKQNEIELRYQNYTPKQYNQILSREFIPNLSIIDMLSNIGHEEVRKILN